MRSEPRRPFIIHTSSLHHTAYVPSPLHLLYPTDNGLREVAGLHRVFAAFRFFHTSLAICSSYAGLPQRSACLGGQGVRLAAVERQAGT